MWQMYWTLHANHKATNIPIWISGGESFTRWLVLGARPWPLAPLLHHPLTLLLPWPSLSLSIPRIPTTSKGKGQGGKGQGSERARGEEWGEWGSKGSKAPESWQIPRLPKVFKASWGSRSCRIASGSQGGLEGKGEWGAARGARPQSLTKVPRQLKASKVSWCSRGPRGQGWESEASEGWRGVRVSKRSKTPESDWGPKTVEGFLRLQRH